MPIRPMGIGGGAYIRGTENSVSLCKVVRKHPIRMDESKDTWTTPLGVVENAWTTLEVLTSTYGVVQACLFSAKIYTELTGHR